MALRIRKDGRVLCAAYNPPEPGDLYLDDYVHEYLGWCIPNNHPATRQLDNYDKETHEYYIDGSEREEKVKRERAFWEYANKCTSEIYAAFGLEQN